MIPTPPSLRATSSKTEEEPVNSYHLFIREIRVIRAFIMGCIYLETLQSNLIVVLVYFINLIIRVNYDTASLQ